MTAISVSERLLEMAAFYTPLALTVTKYLTPLMVGAFLFSVVLGIAFEMYPAAKVSGMMPMAALGSE